MAGRSDLKKVFFNNHELYAKKAKERGISGFNHYGFPEFYQMNAEDVSELTTIGHIWTVGDRYYKLSQQFYGDPEYWWLIAWFNEKPTDAHLDVGDPVYIPLPLEDILGMFYSAKG